jgi:hypothetical protein
MLDSKLMLKKNTNRHNRFGGQAISVAVNYTHKDEFAAAGYTPFKVDGTEYGEVRQYGNFSFLRVYEVGLRNQSNVSVNNDLTQL